jgi:regulator of sigma E protease
MLNFLIGNDLLSAIVAFALVLIPAVLIHELGHFLAAKAVGIAILEFGIGFPPRIAKLFRWGETDFTLNWIPLGGFVRPLGEDMVRQLGEAEVEKERQQLYEQSIAQPDEPTHHPHLIADDGEVIEITDKPYIDEPPTEQKRKRGSVLAVHEARPLGRIFFMSAGALANFASAFVIFVLIAMIGVPEQVGGRVGVVTVTPGSALAQAGLRDGDFIEDLNGQKFASSLDFFIALHSLPADEEATLTIRRANSVEPVQISFTPSVAETQQTETFVRVMAVVEDAPAEAAGMMPGDLIVEFNGEPLTVTFSGAPVNVVERLQALTQENLGEEVTITLQRNSETVEISLVPRQNPPEGQGAMGIVIQPAFHDMATGVTYQEGPVQRILVSQSFGEAVQYSASSISYVVGNILRVPGELIRGTIDVETARPVSIVGISQMGGEFLQQSIEEGQPVVILNYMALISVALGLTNLLPIPALDGGRILFVLIEIVRGRPIAPEREGLVHLVGLVLLLSVTVVFILNDLLNPITELIR